MSILSTYFSFFSKWLPGPFLLTVNEDLLLQHKAGYSKFGYRKSGFNAYRDVLVPNIIHPAPGAHKYLFCQLFFFELDLVSFCFLNPTSYPPRRRPE